MRPLPSIPATRARRADLRAWAFAAGAAAVWFEVLWRTAQELPVSSLSPAVTAAAGLATQLAFTALEASLGVAAWSIAGRRVRWEELAPALLVVSLSEAFAVGLVAGSPALPAAWRVVLAGARAATEPVAGGALAQAFAGLGLLTLARLALATHAHAAALRRGAGPAPAHPERKAALLVLAFYAASRLAIWWGVDLVRGRSFEP